MKLTARIPLEAYAYLEVEFASYDEYLANFAKIKAEATKSLTPSNDNELPWDNEPTYTPTPPPPVHDKPECKKCYSEMIPGKNGQPYCVKCYKEWAAIHKPRR